MTIAELQRARAMAQARRRKGADSLRIDPATNSSGAGNGLGISTGYN